MSSSRAFLLTAAILTAGLSACATPPPIADLPRLPTERYPAKVAVVPQQLMLRANAQGLSQAQRTAVYDLMTRWRTAQGGPIVIEAPSAGGPAAGQAASRVAEFLAGYGVGGADVSIRPSQGEAAVIRVIFPTYTAEIPKCGYNWEDLSRPTNESFSNFGCATSANIQAMVSDPADLTYPAPLDPADASRRQTVLEKYRAGTDTATSSTVSASSKPVN